MSTLNPFYFDYSRIIKQYQSLFLGNEQSTQDMRQRELAKPRLNTPLGELQVNLYLGAYQYCITSYILKVFSIGFDSWLCVSALYQSEMSSLHLDVITNCMRYGLSYNVDEYNDISLCL